MQWTTDKPTKPGWYWWRIDHHDRAEPVYIKNHANRLIVMSYPYEFEDLNEFKNLQWAGPIAEPEES